MIGVCSTGFLAARTCLGGVHRALGDLTERTARAADTALRYAIFGALVIGVPTLFASGAASMYLLVYLPGGIFLGSMASVGFLASSINNNPHSPRNALKADLIARILLWSSLIFGGLYCGFAAQGLWSTAPAAWEAVVAKDVLQASIGFGFITFILGYAAPLPSFITNSISIVSLMQTLCYQSLFTRESYDQLHQRLRDNIQVLEAANEDRNYGTFDLIGNLSVMMRTNPAEPSEIDRAVDEIFPEFSIPEEGSLSDRQIQQQFADRARNMSAPEIREWVGRFPNVLNFRFLASFLPREKLDEIAIESLESCPTNRNLFSQMSHQLRKIEENLIPWERKLLLSQVSHELLGEIETILEVLAEEEREASQLMPRFDTARIRLEELRGRVQGNDARPIFERIEDTARSFSYFERHRSNLRLKEDLEKIRKQVLLFKLPLFKEQDLAAWRRLAKESYEIVGRYAKDLINFSVFLKQLLGGDLPEGYENPRELERLKQITGILFRQVWDWDDDASASRGGDLRSRLHRAIYVENLDQNHPMAVCYEALRSYLTADDFGRLGALLDIPANELQPDTKIERTVRELISYGLKTRADLDLIGILERPEEGAPFDADLLIGRIVAFCKSRPRVNPQGVRLPWRIQFPPLPSLLTLAGRVFDTALYVGLLAAQVSAFPGITAVGFAAGGIIRALTGDGLNAVCRNIWWFHWISMDGLYPVYQDYPNQSISESMRSLFRRVASLPAALFMFHQGALYSGMRHAFAVADGYIWVRQRMMQAQ